jgi:hypothetical protein
MFRNVMVLCVALLCAGCASSSHTLIGQARPPTNPGDVRIYTAPPKRYEQIALLDATSGGSLARNDEHGADEAVQRLREEAAKLGANGVLLTGVADQAGGSIGFGVGGGGFSAGRRSFVGGGGDVGVGTPIMHKAARGIAIYVPNAR